MAMRLNQRERQVLDFILSKEPKDDDTFTPYEVTDKETVEHFRGVLTSTTVVNLLDALYTKGYTTKRWPNWHTLRPSMVPKKEAKE